MSTLGIQNTNVILLYSMLQHNEKQLVHYQAGLGAYMPPKFVPTAIARQLDAASGWSLQDHVVSLVFVVQRNSPILSHRYS